MKVTTIPLIFSHDKTCARFWDGFFNYSNREWIVLKAKGKEIKAIEIRNPNTHSLNALKIAMLFTVIVPLIAAIIFLIKASHLKKYSVTLISQDELQKVNAVAQTKIPEVEPVKKQPLDAHVAQDYIKNGDVDWNSETSILLQNLEKIPFSLLKKWDVKNPQEVFPNLKEIEVAYDEISEESIPLLKAFKETTTLTFIGVGFKDPTFVEKEITELISLLNKNPKVLLQILRNLKKLDGELFKAILHEENISKLSADEHGEILFNYGLTLWDENEETILAYLSSESVLKNPNAALSLLNDIHVRRNIHALFASATSEELESYASFVKNLKALLFHPEATSQNQLDFCLNYKKVSQIFPFILEFLKNTSHLEKLQKELEPKKISIMSNVREWDFYLSVLHIYEQQIAPLDNFQGLIHIRPPHFDLSQLKFHAGHFDFLAAVEALYHLHKEDLESVKKALFKIVDHKKVIKALGIIIPLDQFEKIFRFFEKNYLEHSIAKIRNQLFPRILEKREELAITKLLQIVLGNFNSFILGEKAIQKFFKEINTPRKLEQALDVIERLPQKIKDAFLHAFLGGIRSPPEQQPLIIGLSKHQIAATYHKRQLARKEYPILIDDFLRGAHNA